MGEFFASLRSIPNQGTREVYEAFVRGFVREAVEARLASGIFAVAAGLDPLRYSPDGEALRAAVDHPRARGVITIVARAAARRFGKAPTKLEPQELATVLEVELPYGKGPHRLTPGVRRLYRKYLVRVYRNLTLGEAVHANVAVAAGVHPLLVSPDRELMRAVLDRYRGVRASALRRLARFAARHHGKAPTGLTAEEIREFLAVEVRPLSTSGSTSTREVNEWSVLCFFEHAARVGLVSEAVALAADPYR